MAAEGGSRGMRSMDIGVYGARAIPSTYSGYETFLTTLLPALVARGHRVTMYCRTTDLGEQTPYEGVERVLLPAVAGKQFNTLSHGAVAAVRARLARHEVVLVVNVANALFCGLARWTGQRVVLNTDGQEWLRGKWGTGARAYFRLSAKASRRCATALVSDCAAMADIYAEEFGAASSVIPYCFPDVSEPPASAALDQHGVETGEYYVIAGRLNPENNIDRVAEAYADLDPTRPLLVLGAANYDSPVQHRLEEVARRCPLVRPIGHIADRGEFLALLGSAAAYLHAHSVGGMNPSLVEAMHAGALVLALQTTFNAETLGTTGRYFDLEPGGLARAIAEIEAMPPAQAAQLRSAARARVEQRFGADEVMTAYEQLLAATLDSPSRATVTIPTRWERP